MIHKSGKWCYISNTGKVVIEPRFERAFEFSEGLAVVEQGDTWGYIDKTGEMVAELRKPFDGVGRLSEGLAPFRIDGKCGYIGRAGKPVIEPRFDYAVGFAEGLAVVKVGKKRGYVEKTGEFVIQPQFGQAGDFSEGLAAVEVDEKWGYIDKTGKFVIEPRFKHASAFSEGLAAAMVEGGLRGVIDRTGKFVVEPRFRVVGKFSKGMAVVGVGNAPDCYGYVDRTGEFVIEPRFKRAVAFSEGLACAKIDKKYGYIDRTGKVVIEPQWDAARSFHGGLAKVLIGDKKWDTDKWFYIDRTGKRIWDVPGPMYEAILGSVKTRRRIPKTPRWWLRLRALDPDGKPLSGVQVWADEVIDAQLGMSSPVGWGEISHSGRGTAAARRIGWTKASGFVTPRGGVLEVGPFRGYVEYRFRLYHPDYAAFDVCASTTRYWFDDKRILQVGDLMLPRGNTIRGVVTDAGGAPVKDAWVAAQPTGLVFGPMVGWIRTARTDADGRYVLRGLERFRFKVAAWFPSRHPPTTAEADFSPPEVRQDEWAVKTLDFRFSARR